MKKKELIKDISLVLLIALSVYLYYEIWFSEKLWPEGYNFFTIHTEKLLSNLGLAKENETITVAIEDIILPKRLVITGNDKRFIAIKGSTEYNDCYPALNRVISKIDTGTTKAATVEAAEWSAALKSKSILLDFGSVYSTDLFAQINLPIPGSAAKDIILTPGDSVIAKPVIYVKDFPTGDIYKMTVDTTDKEISDIIKAYVSGENVKNMPFAFELGFDKTKSDVQGNIVKTIPLDSNIIIGLLSENVPKIQASTPAAMVSLGENSQTVDSILKLFNFNRNTTRRYVEKNDALVFIDKKSSLKIYPSALVEYAAESGGIELYSDKADKKDAVAQSLSTIYSLVRNVLRTCGASDPQLQISSDLYDLSMQNFSATINIDYFVNGRPAMIDNEDEPVHPISINIENGKIVSYRQYICSFAATGQTLTVSPMLKALDNLYQKLQNVGGDVTVADIYTTYVTSLDGDVRVAWYAKLKDLDKIVMIDSGG